VQLGMVGLGRMGANLVARVMAAGHECVVYDNDPAAVAASVEAGAVGAESLADLAVRLDTPRAVWVMVPASLTAEVIDDVVKHLDDDDVVIDGGNSYYRDDIDRAEQLRGSGIHHIDVGTSGGVFGLRRGFCLMIGGDGEVVSRLDPIFAAVAPGVEAAPRSPGRTGEPSRSEQGYLHCGSHGAGHFVKMVHNGVEYGIMASYAEGMNILSRAGLGAAQQQHGDAETAPLRDPGYYRFDIDTAEVAQVWRRGSVIASWLLDLAAVAIAENPSLDNFSGQVSDSGEGRWTIQAAVELGVPASVLSTALFDRFSSRHDADYGDRLLSALRKQFGGHDEKTPA
jgi:6-phosphogluconate dehydrogenase